MADSPRVLVTRAPHQGSELADRLRAFGLEPVLIPAIELAEPSSFDALDEALAHLERFDWLLFTSANAVEVFARRSDSCAIPSHPRIAAIGPATARALAAIGVRPNVIPPQAVAESLASALQPHARREDGTPAHFLLIRAEVGREDLPDALRAAGAQVAIAAAYRTVLPEASVSLLGDLFGSAAPPVAAITFTSSSTARNFLALCEAAQVAPPQSAKRISIGPITSATLRDLGYPPHQEAAEATLPALAEAVLQALGLLRS